MANVLILSLVFEPDNVSTAQLMGELAVDLKRLGHNVRVISTVPHYNPAAEALAAQPLCLWFLSLVRKSVFQGIPVYHVWVPRKGRNLFVRGLGWGLFHVVSTLTGLLIPFRGQVLLTPSPPITIGVSAWIIGVLRRSRVIYNVQEIYPDVAIHLGILRSRTAICAMYAVEHFVYKKAAVLTTISAGMHRRILAKGVSPGKVRLIPNFVDIRTFDYIPKDNDFSRKYGINHKFVLSYAGNMGKPQGLEVFIKALVLLRDLPQLQLLMIGSGSEYNNLCAMSRDLNLANVTFLPQQPYSMVPLVYASSDLSIVAQSVGTYSDGIPSKVYRIMGSGRAVFAYTHEDSDLGMLVHEAKAGLVVSSPEVTCLASAIRTAVLSPDEWIIAGERARDFVKTRFNRQLISKQYSDLVSQIANE